MDSLKLLFVGNSFAVDTVEHLAGILHDLGVREMRLCTLFVGGCSIDMHYEHAIGEMAVYRRDLNTGDGWEREEGHSISEAIAMEDWDWIAIQHGTSGTSRYTSPECYRNLPPLIRYIKERAPAHTRIAFNLTWMGESTRQHHEILSYGGDIAEMRRRLEEVTREVICKEPLVDLLIPTGTAIENARTSRIGLLTRDCYHLSVDKGRYIAALTLAAALTEKPIEGISWTPSGVDDYARRVAVESAVNALRHPLTITPSALLE